MSNSASNVMPDMNPITPLGGRTPRIDTHGGVTLTENVDTALTSFAARLGQEAAATKTLASFVGTPAPGPGKMTGGEIAAIWMGPDQWMVTAPHSTHEDLAARLAAKAKGTASVTEQNDAWCRFDLTGQGLVAVFELLCPVNLHAWTGGQATRTSIDHLGCFVLCHGAEAVTVLGPRSSAGSLHHALLTAMRAAL
ncbi:sarcosine oxidase subunit gamma [Thalassobacter stenotrophicus]|uniref:sarcosine oxidase subunit gamma n=1 Tax=Thalassobacter stenotrophicus TaxID=266809 RepID=UPI000B1A0C44|nr:sarcosine oxidase subunit gamma [Thalassobacter stenotrophicus]